MTVKWAVFACAVGWSTIQAFDGASGRGSIDFDRLPNYANQPVPAYVDEDNTPPDNPITDAGALLGRVLFYDKRLSSARTVSCASCHRQEHAFSDLAARSEGVHGALTPRHSMRLVNVRFSDLRRMRWDRTATSLEDQSTMPIKDGSEMGFDGLEGRPGMPDLLKRLTSTPFYAPLFAKAFGDPEITEARLQRALAQFMRSIQSFDSKYDEGRAKAASDRDDFVNFTDEENAGKRLFMADYRYVRAEVEMPQTPTFAGGKVQVAKRVGGGLNCASCHRAPEFDIDPASGSNGFVGRAIPNALGNRVTRAPSLRNLVKSDGSTLNGGMFHAGEAITFDHLIDHYASGLLDPRNRRVDPRLRPEGLPQHLDMTPTERRQLVAFLGTLTGRAVYTDERWSDPFDAEGNLKVVGAFQDDR